MSAAAAAGADADAEEAAWEAACVAHAAAVEARLCAADAGGASALCAYGSDTDDFEDRDGASEAGEDGPEDADDVDAATLDHERDADDAPAKRARQADIRAWFGGVPPPPAAPPPPRVQADIRSWLGGGALAPAALAAAEAAATTSAAAAAPAAPRRCPFYKRIEGTPFAVDAFTYGPVPGVQAYFLTHFHADHYMGLGPAWAGGPIYCTPTTARLAAARLRVPASCLRPIELGVRTLVCGCHVTLLDANHCPGAAMLLLALPGAPPAAPLCLHTGDFRASAALLARPEVSRLAGRLALVYLDTTYCDDRYAFPEQEEVLAAVAARAVAARAAAPRTLFVVGAYAIGKERVALAIAHALGCGICVDAGRAALYRCFDWPELAARLTRRPDATPLHVVPIAWLTPKRLTEYLAQHGAAHDRVLAFRPTGWAHAQRRPAAVGAPASGRVVIEGVPYSEHSSAAELAAFLAALQPRRVQPTVGVGTPAGRARMAALLQQWQAGRGVA